jgi:hypothetical protein
MFSKIISLAFVSLLARAVAAQELALLTPKLTQCQEAQLEWSGGSPKYALFMLPYNDPCGDAAKEWPYTSKNVMHYNVSVPAGAKVVFLVEDANGDEAWTAPITVDKGDDDSCLDQKATDVLKAAGALAVNNGASAASASAASSQAAGSIYAPPIAATGAPGAKGPYPTLGSGSSSDGVANAANSDDTPQQSGSLPRAQVAGPIAGLAILLFSLFQL